jgi:hypothetical protein
MSRLSSKSSVEIEKRQFDDIQIQISFLPLLTSMDLTLLWNQDFENDLEIDGNVSFRFHIFKSFPLP